jgi:beta-1,4-mannosyl-glycoprotein beta-1,4-N-acetylglucosaminyltransferase
MFTVLCSVFILCVRSISALQIYDCFTFFNEKELLKVRLEELYDSVDYFVLVEATETFSGESKPLHFLNNKDFYEKYLDKIIHIIVDDLPKPTSNALPDHWFRQEFQLNAIVRGLKTCNENDIIIISDLDEIPNHQAIEQIKQFFENQDTQMKDENQFVCELHMRLFLFQLNCESSYGWKGAVKAVPYWIISTRSPWSLKLLHMYDQNLPKIYDAGWHFHSICGNKESLVAKLRGIYRYNPMADFALAENFPGLGTLSEVEDWDNHVDDFVKWSLNFFGSHTVSIDNSYPEYIRRNIGYFRDLGWLGE